MKHKHHLIPRYMGGSDAVENLVEVTLNQHIMFHFCNYQLWGNYQDKVAYKFLANSPDREESMRELQKEAARKWCRERDSNPELLAQISKQTSISKKAKAHITSAQLKQQYVEGTRVVQERWIEGGRRANMERSRGVRHILTGTIYPSIREAARVTHTSRNTIKNSIKEVGNWEEV